jgi:hypothetical protein
MDQIDVKDAWNVYLGNGVNSCTRNVVLKGIRYILKTHPAVCRNSVWENLGWWCKKVRRDVVKGVILR